MVFVTGSNGLIGSFITKKLIDEGYAVKALKRKSSDLSMLDGYTDRIEWVEGDLLDYPLLEESLVGVDEVVHAAAIVSFAGTDEATMHQVNVDGTAYLVNAALKNSVKKFCFISSVAALGRTKDGETINEQNKWQESSYNTAYAESKYLAELEVWRGMEEGLNAFILNPSVVLGPGDWFASSSKLFRYVWKQPLFYPAGSMNCIDVRDVAAVFYQLFQKDVRGERFIVNAHNVRIRTLFDKIAMNFGRRKPVFRLTPFIAGIAWRLARIRSFITGRPAALSRETARMSFRTFYYDNSRLKKRLNGEFIPIDDTITWVCGELKKRYRLP